MTARLLMTADEVAANPDQWHAARAHGVTASEIAAIMGISPKSQGSAFETWVNKTHGYITDDEELPEDDPRTRGRDLEPVVARRYAARYPDEVIESGGLYQHTGRPWQMCTFDRLRPVMRPLEIKTVHEQSAGEELPLWGEEGTDEIPDHILAQCLWQADVAGATEVTVAALFMLAWRVRVFRVRLGERERGDIEYMRQGAEEFLAKVKAGVPPPVDWRPATTAALRRLHPSLADREQVIAQPLSDAYRAAVNTYRRAEKERNLATNRLREAGGDARVLVDERGRKLATHSISDTSRIDPKYLRAEWPEAAAAATRVSPVDKITPAWRGDT